MEEMEQDDAYQVLLIGESIRRQDTLEDREDTIEETMAKKLERLNDLSSAMQTLSAKLATSIAAWLASVNLGRQFI